MTQRPTIRIERRFNGPPQSSNGGYVCGCLAKQLSGAVTVRLRRPPPLDTAFEVVDTADGVAMTHAGDAIATARRSEVVFDVPDAPVFDVATAAARDFRGFESHLFPDCFVCGPERAPGDGLRIFPGAIDDAGGVAAPWVPDASLVGDRNRIAPEFVWAALDCPGGFAFAEPRDGRILLGELTAELFGAVSVGERCVLLAHETGRDGRKHFTATALFGESGELRGAAIGTWLEIPDPTT